MTNKRRRQPPRRNGAGGRSDRRGRGGGRRGAPAGGGSRRSEAFRNAPAYLVERLREARMMSPGYAFTVGYGRGSVARDEKAKALNDVCEVGNRYLSAFRWGRALQERQRRILEQRFPDPGDLLLIQRTLAWRFVTGTGQEHPSENGFTFYWPFGVPVLPGSAVKGALRRAAETLCSVPESGWNPARVWLLFGFDASATWCDGSCRRQGDRCVLKRWRKRLNDSGDEASAELIRLAALVTGTPDGAAFLELVMDPKQRRQIHLRGALEFHDAFIDNDTESMLAVDILTPHYGPYYAQDGRPDEWRTPHDAYEPVPAPFLVVDAGARMQFAVTARARMLPESLRFQWVSLIRSAFDEAAAWQGFGARTAAGYGAFRPEPSPEE